MKSLQKFTKFNKVYMIYGCYIASASKFSTVDLSSAAKPLSIFRLTEIVLKVELAKPSNFKEICIWYLLITLQSIYMFA